MRCCGAAAGSACGRSRLFREGASEPSSSRSTDPDGPPGAASLSTRGGPLLRGSGRRAGASDGHLAGSDGEANEARSFLPGGLAGCQAPGTVLRTSPGAARRAACSRRCSRPNGCPAAPQGGACAPGTSALSWWLESVAAGAAAVRRSCAKYGGSGRRGHASEEESALALTASEVPGRSTAAHSQGAPRGGPDVLLLATLSFRLRLGLGRQGTRQRLSCTACRPRGLSARHAGTPAARGAAARAHAPSSAQAKRSVPLATPSSWRCRRPSLSAAAAGGGARCGCSGSAARAAGGANGARSGSTRWASFTAAGGGPDAAWLSCVPGSQPAAAWLSCVPGSQQASASGTARCSAPAAAAPESTAL
jgi:hypothetical protein